MTCDGESRAGAPAAGTSFGSADPVGTTPGGRAPSGTTPGGMSPGGADLVTLANSVILAENDMAMRSVIRSVLLRAEQQVFPAADGVEAVMLARQFRARLVMLDIGMPRLNGLEACKAIRALPGYAAVPIVMLTGHCDDRVRLAAQRVGANDFVTKPFRPNVLLARLAAYLDLPSHMLPAAPTGADDVLPGTRVHEWKPRPEMQPAYAGNSQLTDASELMRVYRQAERKG